MFVESTTQALKAFFNDPYTHTYTPPPPREIDKLVILGFISGTEEGGGWVFSSEIEGGREREREIEKWLKEEKETVVWKGLQISFRCDTRRIYDWNETTPKRGLIREKNKMRRNSGDQIFIKIVGFSSFYDRFIIDIARFELRGGKKFDRSRCHPRRAKISSW